MEVEKTVETFMFYDVTVKECSVELECFFPIYNHRNGGGWFNFGLN